MKLAFDLISDLHIKDWSEFDWTGQATSPFCIVAGDIARDLNTLERVLAHLSKCYQGVFYIDGNEEHKAHWDDIESNFHFIHSVCGQLENVVYLQDNVIVLNGIAIIAANGWWSWDFDPSIDPVQTKHWFCERYIVNPYVTAAIDRVASIDINYLAVTINQLQSMDDVERIVMVTHTVPTAELIKHDTTLEGNYLFNVMGNRSLQAILRADYKHKIDHWCFGHYHMPVDRVINGIRYVNNCRGRVDTPYYKSVYYPLRIELES